MAIYKTENEKKQIIDEILKKVYEAPEGKGYDLLAQITESMFNGDPTRITPHNNARDLTAPLGADESGYRLLKVCFKG